MAEIVATVFYGSLGRGITIGESLRRACESLGEEDIRGKIYSLYGAPQASLQGEGTRTLLRASIPDLRLPSGQELSVFDRQRVERFREGEKTQLLTLVMIELPKLEVVGQTRPPP